LILLHIVKHIILEAWELSLCLGKIHVTESIINLRNMLLRLILLLMGLVELLLMLLLLLLLILLHLLVLSWIVIQIKLRLFMSSILNLGISDTEKFCKLFGTFFILLRYRILPHDVESILLKRVHDVWA
jgi:uncharacterized membrane protein